MKNNTKRLVSALICLAMVLAVLPMAVFAAGTTTLYCDAPDDWSCCHVYWWGASENNPEWPGVEMTQGADGIWSAEVASDATNVIFTNKHDKETGVQSGDLAMPTDNNVQYNYEANAWGAYGAEVEVVEKYFIAGDEALCGKNWDPGDPANEMTETSDGVWVKSYTNVAAGSYQFKVTVGSWSKDWGVPTVDEEGNTKVENYVLELAEASDVTITFTPADGAITVETTAAGSAEQPSEPADPSEPVEDPSEPAASEPAASQPEASEPAASQPEASQPEASEPAATGVTVTATVPSDWTNVRIWAWLSSDNSNPLGGDWPGTAMTKNGDKYSIVIPSTSVDRIVINGDVDGAVKQTVDLNVVAGKNADIVIGAAGDDGKFAAEVTYNGSVVVAPVDPSLKGDYRVVGDAAWMGAWDPANALGLMSEVSDGVYEITFKNVPVGNYEFKVTKDGTWDNAWGQGGIGGGNIAMAVTVAGDVTVRLNVGTGSLTYKTAASGEWVPVTGDMGIAAVCAALLFASAGLVCAVSKKKEF